MVLNTLLISHFVHLSRLSATVVVACSAVAAVNIDPRHRCFSGLALCSNVFVVSY